MKWLSIDSPLMVFLGKVADLMWLNVLTIVCCVPIITAGASFTALHYVCLKIVRGEECYITKAFFHSFKDNLGQSTVLWILALFMALLFGLDFYLIAQGNLGIPSIVQWGIVGIAILLIGMISMFFPVQAKFVNSILGTIKTALTLALLQFPKTILSVLLYTLPWLLAYLSFSMWPFALMFGISVPAYISALFYNKRFKVLEERFLAENPSEEENAEKIFSDDPILTESSELYGK